MSKNDSHQNFEFDRVRFIHVIIIVVFISLLLFGSTNIQNETAASSLN